MVRALFCHKSTKTTPKSLRRLLLPLLLAGLAACTTPAVRFPAPVVAGHMAEPLNREASGLAASRRDPGMLWTHNDSGGDPVLFALAAGTGALRGKVRLEGVANYDWEDVASFELDGRSWLLVADTGDNFAQRPGVVLHVIEEPTAGELSPEHELVVRPAYSIHFAYEDGARDCEAVAVDPRQRAVWLLSKRDVPARLYRLPLHAAPAEEPAQARLRGTVPHLRQPDIMQKLVHTPNSALRGMPTAMDFASDGSAATVLIYGDLLLFRREAGEGWEQALAREPVELPKHPFPQAEAIAFSPDGRGLYLCSEKDDRLLRYDLP